jgi:16S rRNA (guanine(966)-N(2))-methyltransferase RsmD
MKVSAHMPKLGQPLKSSRSVSLRGVSSHEIRIIGGLWKRTRLKVADKPGLRPTPDRVRETLFNWLGQDLSGWRCMDAFAGTGALGLEAASRGADSVILVEQDGALVTQLRAMKEQLKADAVEVMHGNGAMLLGQLAPASQDLIFLDPPFESDLFKSALLAASQAVAEDGFIYLEAPSAWSDTQLADLGLVVHRYLKAGAVHAHLLRHASPAVVA